MPFPRLFKRHRTTSAYDDAESPLQPPRLISGRNQSHAAPDLRRGISLPLLIVAPNTQDLDASLNTVPGKAPISNNSLAIPGANNSKGLPPTATSAGPSPAISNDPDGMGAMWKGIENKDANILKGEKTLNKLSDFATGAVETTTTTDGVVGFVKGVIASEEVQAIGKTILEGVPAIMNTLETLTEVHPFLKVAYLPFKLIYHQETQRRDNNQKRGILFEKIKDVMLVLLELKGFSPDDTRTTPEGKPILSRLANICKDMRKDIEECYNVLNVQDKHSVTIKFLKASSWNAELTRYGSRFETRRGELSFTLQMRTAVTVEETNKNMKIMMEMFQTIMTSQERDMANWIKKNGGDAKTVLADDAKCAAMIKYEASITANSDPTNRSEVRKPEQSRRDEPTAIAALRKSYRDDIQVVIKENFESFSKLFEMGLDDLNKDLSKKIKREGDRVIKYLQGGPHSRISDKMLYHIWKDQGWKGSAKTRPLVLAIRDYFVERVERSKLPTQLDVVKKPPAENEDKDDDDDPESNMSVTLPDAWMIAYLQVKRLRYLQQILDADASGFTTVSEINNFTHARPEKWSLPRWICYWAIGWQIFATKYCIEIEELYAQMSLVRTQIGIHMPGNKRYVNGYIEGTWQYVTALTSSIERYDSASAWLTDKFTSHVEAQEADLKVRLEKIQYDIDTRETVNLILGRVPIEQCIFVLLVLLMRRHLAKMHLCLKQEIDWRELDDDRDTVTWVVDAAWHRFIDLKDYFSHQQVPDLKQTFDWLSCGLFKNYFDWNERTSAAHFMASDETASSSADTIKELDKADLTKILLYDTQTAVVVNPEPETEKSTPEEASPPLEEESLATLFSPVTKPSAAEMSITGTWYGFHWTEDVAPYYPMTCLNIKCGERQNDSATGTPITGSGENYNYLAFTIYGEILSTGQGEGSLSVIFERSYDDGFSVRYVATFFHERELLTGTFERPDASGSFFFKKVGTPSVLCLRPLKENLDAKELWSYAYSAVLDNIRRQRLGTAYLYERITKMRQVIVLLCKEERNTLSDAERVEQAQLSSSFSYAELRELYILYSWYDRLLDLQPRYLPCDGCGASIRRSRVVCLDCISPTQTLNFCFRPECIANPTIPQRTDITHLPSHTMMKTRDLFMLKDYYMSKLRAQNCLAYARRIYQDPPSDTSLTVPLPPSPSQSNPAISAIDSPTAESDPPSPRLPEDPPSVGATNGSLSITVAAVPSIDKPAPLHPNTESVLPSDELLEAPDTSTGLGTENQPQSPDSNIPEEDQVGLNGDSINEFVCDSCEAIIDDLPPWDYQERYRSEVQSPSSHNAFHLLVRVARTDGTDGEAGEAAIVSHSPEPMTSPVGQWEHFERRIEELVAKHFEDVQSHVDKRLEDIQIHVDKRLEEVESRLTTGFASIEKLLAAMMAKHS